MNSECKEVFSGVMLRVVRTDKFKNSCFSFNFFDKLTEEHAEENALIPQVLCRGSKSFPDIGKIAEECDGLYGMRIEPTVRKFGEIQAFGVLCDFVDGKYTDMGNELLEKAIALAGDIVLNPLVSDGGFSPEYTAGEIENLKDEIKSEINSKLSYAYRRAVKAMYPDSGMGINELGDAQRADNVTPQSLLSRYNEVSETAPIQIFYCGNSSFEEIEKIVCKVFKKLKKRRGIIFRPSCEGAVSDADEVIEQMDMSQAVLLLGTDSGVTYESEDFYSMRVFNSVLGGGTASKLFVNVREKKSLCYYTGAKYDRFSGNVFLYCGVEPEKVDTARAEMLNQLKLCAQGSITEEELNNAKITIINQLKEISDSPYSLENYWLNEASCASVVSPEETVKKIGEVSLDDVTECAKKCKLKLTYLLTGKGENVHERKYLSGN